jgi:beta-lactamase class A
MLTRRFVMFGSAALCVGPVKAAVEDSLSALEAKSGGRLGVAILDTQSGRSLNHRADERFAMCSTFKLMLAAAVLARVETGKEQGDRVIRYGKSDLLTHSPVTEKHLSSGVSVETLCTAVVRDSDNTGANLLLQTLGGPAGWTSFVRQIGDETSRLDRMELALNSAIPGDARDTTTPAAMLQDLQKVLLGDVLSARSRRFLIDAMATSPSGLKRLRAGLPKDWLAADKTGTGFKGPCNDIGIFTPPGRAPVLACAYLTDATVANAEQEAVLADIGRLIASF